MILGGGEGVLEVISVEGLGVIEELDLIGLVVLGIVPGVVSLVVWGDVRVAVSNLVVLVDGGLIPGVSGLLPWLVIPSSLEEGVVFQFNSWGFGHTELLNKGDFLVSWDSMVVLESFTNRFSEEYK